MSNKGFADNQINIETPNGIAIAVIDEVRYHFHLLGSIETSAYYQLIYSAEIIRPFLWRITRTSAGIAIGSSED